MIPEKKKFETGTDRCFPFLGDFKCTSPFGKRNPPKTMEGYGSSNHMGVDLVGIGDINVVSCSNGTVKIAKTGQAVGKYVWITTDDGYGLIYQHLKSFDVKPGDRVVCKQKIGVMGNTGNSGGAHLHFGVAGNTEYKSYYKNAWIDPALWFNVGQMKGKTFNGSGMISGQASNILTTNNPNQTVSNETYSFGGFYSGGMGALLPSGEFYEVDESSYQYGDWLYGRKYRVLVDVGNNKTMDVSELRCTFQITKDMTSLEANTAKLSIYNLSPEIENLLIKEGQRIIIEAGYEGSQYGIIFSGNVVQPIRSKENGTDFILTLLSMDADRYVTYGIINISMSAKQSQRQAINSVLNKSSEKVGSGYLTNTDIIYPRGKVMFGQSKYYLAQLAKSQNSTFYIDDGMANIVSPVDIEKGRVLAFGPDSGLINAPQQNEIGVSFQVLLNPQVKLNSICKLDNTKVANYEYNPGSGQAVRSLDSQGLYRVVKLTHFGDTRGEKWYTEVSAVSQAGMLPDAVAGTAVYPW